MPNVLVIGANGFIGLPVCRCFVREGWSVYGLVRNASTVDSLVTQEITPILGALSDVSFLPSLYAQVTTFDVIVSATDVWDDYKSHFEELIVVVRDVAKTSLSNGVRSLVLWSSGCKDYGNTTPEGTPGLEPHTESSPLNPPDLLRARCENSLRIFEETALFDAAIIRPTNLYGFTASGYAITMDLFTNLAKSGETLHLSVPKKSIIHGTHTSDCAEAYLSLALHPNRSEVAGQCFNVSAERYDTTESIANAMAKEYNIPGGVVWHSPEERPIEFMEFFIWGYCQWVGSDKIRKLTGWKDKKPTFSEGLKTYRAAYEASKKKDLDGVGKIERHIHNALVSKAQQEKQ
ncbi:hypothetical protein DL96DRAFT_424075 [Flagelloscypha sp. PMI_526]|nr:hypothetical protein DL96DRAFT_424075 [Flagelloscypha sp. PMI_526]